MPRFITSMARPARALAPRFTTWMSRLALAVLALAIVGGGSAVAASKLITGKQIKKNTITAANIKKGSLSADTLSSAAKKALAGAGATGPAGTTGAAGAAGAPGATGPTGPVGPTGPSDAFVKRQTGTFQINNATSPVGSVQETVGSVAVPPGSYVFSSAFSVVTSTSDSVLECRVFAEDTEIDAYRNRVDAGLDTPIYVGGFATLPAGGVIRSTCARGTQVSLTLRDVQTIATRVGTLNVQVS